MQSAWWQYRSWKIVADMNGDGAVTGADYAAWAQFFYFLPGDAFVAQFGPTEFGQYLGLTQASFGSTTSALLSALLWVIAFFVALYAFRFILDAIDPTYRQQQRESRAARARARKREKAQARADAAPEVAVRIEPTLSADFQAEPENQATPAERDRRIAA
jgi:hypothetical protein